MSCEHCADGALARNFCPQLVYDGDAERPFRMVVEFKSLVTLGGEPYWARMQAESLEGVDGEPIARARYCPICGGKLTEVTGI